MSVALSEMYVKSEVKKKYFRTKYTPADVFLSVNATIYCKFKLKLKLRNNKISLL